MAVKINGGGPRVHPDLTLKMAREWLAYVRSVIHNRDLIREKATTKESRYIHFGKYHLNHRWGFCANLDANCSNPIGFCDWCAFTYGTHYPVKGGALDYCKLHSKWGKGKYADARWEFLRRLQVDLGLIIKELKK